jgi:hypothetical protein
MVFVKMRAADMINQNVIAPSRPKGYGIRPAQERKGKASGCEWGEIKKIHISKSVSSGE